MERRATVIGRGISPVIDKILDASGAESLEEFTEGVQRGWINAGTTPDGRIIIKPNPEFLKQQELRRVLREAQTAEQIEKQRFNWQREPSFKRHNSGFNYHLCSGYICRLLCQGTTLRTHQIPSELIDLKRAHLQLTRAIRAKSKLQSGVAA